MPSTKEITDTFQDGFLKAVETSQRLTLEAIGAGVSSFKGISPTQPVMPFAAGTVSPHEVISSSFTFVEQLLESQKTFLTQLVDLAEPITRSAVKPEKH
jgi:hypothetical protein